MSLSLSLSFHVNTCNSENGSPIQTHTHTSSLYTPDFRCSDCCMPFVYPCAAYNTVFATLRIPSLYCFFFHIQTARLNLPNRFSRFKRTFVRSRDGARSETVFNSVAYCIFAIWQIIHVWYWDTAFRCSISLVHIRMFWASCKCAQYTQ